MKLSRQTTHHGIVLFANIDEFGLGFGFISPAGSSGAREENVYFNSRATNGRVFEKADEVDYVLSTVPRKQGLCAYRVWLRKSAVERDDRDAISYVGGD